MRKYAGRNNRNATKTSTVFISFIYLCTIALLYRFVAEKMSANSDHLVIMAGGVGSRFWPMSTPQVPKQFVDVLGTGRTLIQMTMDRFRGLVPPQNVWVVTSKNYVDIVHGQLPDVPMENILLEPCRRNTAPCIAYASWRIKKLNPQANIIVSPSDHVVLDTREFRRIIGECTHFVNENDSIVVLGIKPTRPETGFGYIQTDESVPSSRNRNIYRVDSFREKPDLQTAQSYIAQNCFYWNAGIFVWNVNTIVNALRIYAKEISDIFESLLPVLGTEKEQAAIDEAYSACPAISIDYAVMEKAEDIFCYPSDFGWSDMGTWGALSESSSHDANGNTLIGNVKAFDTRNCIVHTQNEKKVIIQGLDGYIVAECDNQLLICRLSEEQHIKDYTEEN